MLMFSLTRVRSRLLVIGVVLVALAAVGATLFLSQGGDHRGHARSAAPTPGVPGPTGVPVRSSASPAPASSPSAGATFQRLLPRTASADVYAAAVARALWNIDYAATSRQSVLAFWRAQLATVLPAGVPAGTTLSQAQEAALSTVTGYLPGSAMWATLAADRTTSTFHVTGVSEPPAWAAAVTAGKIADPGLTARTVIGVQTLTYGRGPSRRRSRQTEQLTVAMLCPPTGAACELEVFPPRDTAGATA